jgi:hypothetical protein
LPAAAAVVGLCHHQYTIEYQEYEIRPEARASLRPGKNLVAVHAFHDGKQQLIDVGVADRYR